MNSAVEQKCVGKNMKYKYRSIAKTCSFWFHEEISISYKPVGYYTVFSLFQNLIDTLYFLEYIRFLISEKYLTFSSMFWESLARSIKHCLYLNFVVENSFQSITRWRLCKIQQKTWILVLDIECRIYEN